MAVQGFVLFGRCTALRVRCRDVQVCLIEYSGAKNGGGQCKKWRYRVGKKVLPVFNVIFYTYSDLI
jgi:hypothetical protein